MIEMGLCCEFYKEPIKYKIYTKAVLLKKTIEEQKEKILEVCNNNIESLQKSMDYCKENDIKTFRVSSNILPHYYTIKEILSKEELDNLIDKIKQINTHNINLSLHPGQYVNLGSPKEGVIQNSIDDLLYHKLLADCLNFKEINIHLGGTYGDKEEAKRVFIENVKDRIPEIIPYLTIENDELNYHIVEVVDVCKELGIRTTYDLHHQRCYNLKEEINGNEIEWFELAKSTWTDLGYDYMRMHISSPKDGYSTASKSRPHSDYIEPTDIPKWLKKQDFLVYLDIEAKHKECSIMELRKRD